MTVGYFVITDDPDVMRRAGRVVERGVDIILPTLSKYPKEIQGAIIGALAAAWVCDRPMHERNIMGIAFTKGLQALVENATADEREGAPGSVH
jgi:hypothetical protein